MIDESTLWHGGDIYGHNCGHGIVLDFSVNINPLGMPAEVEKAIAWSAKDCICYPDPFCRELRQKLAERHSVGPENVLCGNGAADLIFQLVFALKPRRALLLAPTFREYEQALQGVGCHIEHFMLKQQNQFALCPDDLRQHLSGQDIFFLCNPNNPTGQAVSAQAVKGLAEFTHQHGITLVVDECFQDFLEADCSLLPWLFCYPNVIILRAFTKSYGIPGVRFGYCLTANTAVLEKMMGLRQPWSVSLPAQRAALAVTTVSGYREKTVPVVAAGRRQLSRGLAGLGFYVYPSQANYLLFQQPATPGSGLSLAEQCRRQGILIRSCQNYRGLDEHFYRVCVKLPAENEQLLKLLGGIVSGANKD